MNVQTGQREWFNLASLVAIVRYLATKDVGK